MKRTAVLGVLLALATAPAFAGSCGSHSTTASNNIVETAVSAGSFNTLVAAVQAADLSDTLAGDGLYTVTCGRSYAVHPSLWTVPRSLPDGNDRLPQPTARSIPASGTSFRMSMGLQGRNRLGIESQPPEAQQDHAGLSRQLPKRESSDVRIRSGPSSGLV